MTIYGLFGGILNRTADKEDYFTINKEGSPGLPFYASITVNKVFTYWVTVPARGNIPSFH